MANATTTGHQTAFALEIKKNRIVLHLFSSTPSAATLVARYATYQLTPGQVVKLGVRFQGPIQQGADIRYLMDGNKGNMIHGTVPPMQTNRATTHVTVSEFWYVLEGEGEIWRKDDTEERVPRLAPGVSIDIPAGTTFQYRNTGDRPMKFICVTMPPWPGGHEASPSNGIWEPTV